MNTIQKGSTGADVQTWQKFLGITPPDGIFGEVTKTRTMQWQAQQNLPADGVVGPLSWQKAGFVTSSSAAEEHHDVYQTYVPQPGDYGQPGAPASPPPAPTVSTSPKSTLRLGSKGDDVIAWQSIIGVAPTGTFDAATKTATIAWQKAHKLSADGVVGAATWKAAGYQGTAPASGGGSSGSALRSSMTAPSTKTTTASLLPSLPKLSASPLGVPRSVWLMGGVFGLFLAFHKHSARLARR